MIDFCAGKSAFAESLSLTRAHAPHLTYRTLHE
jgi:hypothetical protein